MYRAIASSRSIAAHLRRGGLIAYPTESCYGLGCDPDNRAAVTPKTVMAAQPVQPKTVVVPVAPVEQAAANETLTPQEATWGLDAEKELRKIPFFVRGKAKRNTERFAIDRGVSLITVETLYDAKAHYGR